jgi:hypothetical protein
VVVEARRATAVVSAWVSLVGVRVEDWEGEAMEAEVLAEHRR